ncbi:unnamed protein product, partial [Prunus brigantina]
LSLSRVSSLCDFPLPRLLFTALKTTTQPPLPATSIDGTGPIRTATFSSLFPGQHSSWNPRYSPEIAETSPDLTGTSSRSNSLLRPPFPTGEVLQLIVRSRQDPLGAGQLGII